MHTPSSRRKYLVEVHAYADHLFAPGEAELGFIGPNGEEYYRLSPISIPGYAYSF